MGPRLPNIPHHRNTKTNQIFQVFGDLRTHIGLTRDANWVPILALVELVQPGDLTCTHMWARCGSPCSRMFQILGIVEIFEIYQAFGIRGPTSGSHMIPMWFPRVGLNRIRSIWGPNMDSYVSPMCTPMHPDIPHIRNLTKRKSVSCCFKVSSL